MKSPLAEPWRAALKERERLKCFTTGEVCHRRRLEHGIPRAPGDRDERRQRVRAAVRAARAPCPPRAEVRRRRRDEDGRCQAGGVSFASSRSPSAPRARRGRPRVAHEADGLVRARHLPHLVGDLAPPASTSSRSRGRARSRPTPARHAGVRFEPAREVAESAAVPERPCTDYEVLLGGAVLVVSSAVLQRRRSFMLARFTARLVISLGFAARLVIKMLAQLAQACSLFFFA